MSVKLKYGALAVVLVSLAGWYFQPRSRPFQVPKLDDVIAISASLYNRPVSGVEISEFIVPQSHHSNILDLFRDAQPDSSPAKWQVLGFVKIETKSGEETVSLYWTGESSGAFSASGRYYRGSSDAAIIAAITDATTN